MLNNVITHLKFHPLLAHAFGQRYELPIPLALFVFGGAGIVLLSFLVVLRRQVTDVRAATADDTAYLPSSRGIWAGLTFVLLGLVITCGLTGSQEIPENIVPTLFWLVVWIAVPLSCGLFGDWTRPLNPFAHIAALVGSSRVRRLILQREQPLSWPTWLGWWPAAALFFAISNGELVYNQTATLPAFIAASLLWYFVASAFLGLLFGPGWLARGEVFTALFSTWGRLGFFRFGAPGRRGFAGGLVVPFEPTPSRVVFVLLLLVSVNFDGLLATPFWNGFQSRLTDVAAGTLQLHLLTSAVFIILVLALWAAFTAFAAAVSSVGKLPGGRLSALAGLLPSLVPIAFGYLLAHNLEYLVVNGQLLFPLIGNPTGQDSWPLHLAYPFNDSFEPNIHLLPSAFYWYLAVVVIVIVHIFAVILAHRYLRPKSKKDHIRARRSEYPWVVAMVGYTMLSLWLLAQPLVKEKSDAGSRATPVQELAVQR